VVDAHHLLQAVGRPRQQQRGDPAGRLHEPPGVRRLPRLDRLERGALATSPFNRRDVLLLRLDRGRDRMELSCERLLMKYLDAQTHGATRALLAGLDGELKKIRELRVVDREWLTREDLAADLDRVLDAFKARGGKVLTKATAERAETAEKPKN